ncbi:PREDICTED: uncharacterized protein LOC108748528 [Trachymyrmex septentrionalis]|uniref:uncharacterized protein LOC108748528 n=1 Tax=Trachymyrmex septentrionalis TaxID=34720 RepID=UPI00084EF36B|nr:PREDICTED: uncharacterized protein LOC108748528 [Trachymyrmex septentrionalis]
MAHDCPYTTFMIIVYDQLLFKSVQLQIVFNHTVNVMIGIVQVNSAIIIIFLVDRLDRKQLTLFSGLIAAASHVRVIAAILLVFTFKCGLLSMQMIMMSKMFATKIKALATCLWLSLTAASSS